jgi:lysophospholipid acyltransferase (LPLAT)-like uncharacterized protein
VKSRLTPWRQFKATAIATIGVPVIEALGSSYSWRESGVEHLARVRRQGKQPILALWHGRILAATLYFRDRGVVAMTSENFDGEWVAQLMNKFGYHAARGSTSHGGARALAQLRREVAQGYPTAFTVDGPRGPARVAQPGAVWLASATGHPIVPFHIEADRFWTVKSWDRHQVPKPGARLAIAIGRPIEVPRRAEAEELESKRAALEQSLHQLESEAAGLVRA